MTTRSSSFLAIDKDMDELDRVVERMKALGASAEDAGLLHDLVSSYAYLTEQIRDKQTTIARLRQMLFGETSEKREKVLGEKPAKAGGETQAPAAAAPRARGHGRHGSDAYPGAERVAVSHATLRPGDACPQGCRGRVYLRQPRRLVRIRGVAPFQGTVYEQEEMRCNLCGEVFPAELPAGVGTEKYDATVTSMVALLRYGSGFPLNRIAVLQESQGIPLPVTTQWDLLSAAAKLLLCVFEALGRFAAQGEVLHNDDTPMVILGRLKEERDRRLRGEAASERTGVFTTGIVAVAQGHRVVIYATGHRHAGENLAALLGHRLPELPAPTQMCDGLDRNVPAEFQTILGNCLVHARRQFVDVVSSFPEEVRYVIDELALVYEVEARARKENLPPSERLLLHQRESGPVMDRLETWFQEQIDEKKVEPNSGLGKAIAYAQKRWGRLTLFLRVEGAPLDNNVCELVLKRAILHRKNSLFYKTENGAHVGDLYMSLIATAKLAKADPFDYLTALQRHAEEIAKEPSAWMPWNYRESLARAAPGGAPPTEAGAPARGPPAPTGG
jgi:transposase